MMRMTGKYVPYEKLSKKAKRRLNAQRRRDWGEISPVTRRPEDTKAYDRNREKRRWKDRADWPGTPAGAFFI